MGYKVARRDADPSPLLAPRFKNILELYLLLSPEGPLSPVKRVKSTYLLTQNHSQECCKLQMVVELRILLFWDMT
jgi:hypothetical protein